MQEGRLVVAEEDGRKNDQNRVLGEEGCRVPWGACECTGRSMGLVHEKAQASS